MMTTKPAMDKRLRELEKVKQDMLTILCLDEHGQERMLSIDEFERVQGEFIRVTSGHSLRDLDRLLELILPAGAVEGVT